MVKGGRGCLMTSMMLDAQYKITLVIGTELDEHESPSWAKDGFSSLIASIEVSKSHNLTI